MTNNVKHDNADSNIDADSGPDSNRRIALSIMNSGAANALSRGKKGGLVPNETRDESGIDEEELKSFLEDLDDDEVDNEDHQDQDAPDVNSVDESLHDKNLSSIPPAKIGNSNYKTGNLNDNYGDTIGSSTESPGSLDASALLNKLIALEHAIPMEIQEYYKWLKENGGVKKIFSLYNQESPPKGLTEYILGLFKFVTHKFSSTVIRLSIPSTAVADYTGEKPENVRRQLSRMKEQGVLDRVTTGSKVKRKASIYQLTDVGVEVIKTI